jgi:hypothetical protein
MTQKKNVIVVENDKQREAFVAASKRSACFSTKRPLPSFASSAIWKK